MSAAIAVAAPAAVAEESQDMWMMPTEVIGHVPESSGARVRRTLQEKQAITMELTKQRTANANQVWRAALESPEELGEDMGAMERGLLRNGRELQRAALEIMMQRKADDTPPRCRVCGTPLEAVQWREIEILSRFGPVTIGRHYGRCPKCDSYQAPADHVLDIAGEGKNSPEMAEQLRLLGTIAPPEQAERLSDRLFGFHVDDSRVARELERAGKEALDERRREDERALSTEGRWEVTAEVKSTLPKEGFVMVIMADGHMVRERDEWGESDELRARGEKPERWHESKVGTIFLLSDRVRCGHKRQRPVILRRSFVGTRAEAFPFSQMLFAQAVRDGMLLASEVYFIADGAVWLWNMKEERFAHAKGTLDHYHAIQHLWAVARARFGEGAEAAKWVRPLIHQLSHSGEAGVLRTLEELAEAVESIEPEKRDVDEKTILREWEYFSRHRDHLDYENKAARGYPIGSGCIEATCKQYQLRVKRCGQFWSTENLEGLLCLYSRYLGGLWN